LVSSEPAKKYDSVEEMMKEHRTATQAGCPFATARCRIMMIQPYNGNVNIISRTQRMKKVIRHPRFPKLKN
jgi:hypothetical protein